MRAYTPAIFVLPLLASCDPAIALENGAEGAAFALKPQAKAWMDHVNVAGRACGMKRVAASVDVLTSQPSIHWDPFEPDIDRKLACLDARLRGRASVSNGGPAR